jgi:hypothetical protein
MCRAIEPLGLKSRDFGPISFRPSRFFARPEQVARHISIRIKSGTLEETSHKLKGEFE